jgi:hypothetical protein
MQALLVDFGTATFSHVKAGLELEVAAEATLQTSHPEICQTVGLHRFDAADLLLLDLWPRARRPLCLSLVICASGASSCSFHERLDFRKEVESALGSSVVCVD